MRRPLARHRKTEEGGGSEQGWLLTYSNIVTLLLTFFVLLFSLSRLDGKRRTPAYSLSGAGAFAQYSPIDPLENVIEPIINLPVASEPPAYVWELSAEQAREQELIDAEFDSLCAVMDAYMSVNGLEGLMDVRRAEGELKLSFREGMLFEPGSTRIKIAGEKHLNEIFMLLEGSQESYDTLRVEGHTDNLPTSDAKYTDNWELSAAWAASVTRMISEAASIDSAKLSMASYGDTRPAADNIAEEGRARNRRVDLVCERREVIGDKRR